MAVSTALCECGSGLRALRCCVCDFNNLSEQPTNQFGVTMGLPNYTVLVKVENSGVSLGAINNTGAIRVLRVDVTVTGPGNTSVTMSGFRTNYECNTGARNRQDSWAGT